MRRASHGRHDVCERTLPLPCLAHDDAGQRLAGPDVHPGAQPLCAYLRSVGGGGLRALLGSAHCLGSGRGSQAARRARGRVHRRRMARLCDLAGLGPLGRHRGLGACLDDGFRGDRWQHRFGDPSRGPGYFRRPSGARGQPEGLHLPKDRRRVWLLTSLDHVRL